MPILDIRSSPHALEQGKFPQAAVDRCSWVARRQHSSLILSPMEKRQVLPENELVAQRLTDSVSIDAPCHAKKCTAYVSLQVGSVSESVFCHVQRPMRISSYQEARNWLFNLRQQQECSFSSSSNRIIIIIDIATRAYIQSLPHVERDYSSHY